jgi:hypothetical protein
VGKGEPQKMEHFGISIVEALGNGLIPLVFDSAGPAEILADYPDLRFTSLADLVKKTNAARELENDTKLKLGAISSLFDEDIFFSTFKKIIFF